MAGTHRVGLRAAATLGAALLAASAAHGEGEPTGAQATAKIGIRLSVRPMVRLSLPAANSDRLCLWSNIGAENYGLRAEWGDGSSRDLEVPSSGPECGAAGVAAIGLEAMAEPLPGRRGGGPMLLMIEAR